MIKSPSQIRSRILNEVTSLLERLRLNVSCWHPDEKHVMDVLKEQRSDVAVAVTNTMMAQFGHDAAPTVSRFDKTRRALNAKTPKPPRGEKAALTDKERKALQARKSGGHRLDCSCSFCVDKALMRARRPQATPHNEQESEL